MFRIKLLFALLFISPLLHANGFVGNGGNGIQLGSKIFVYDLFILSAHTKPYFGNEIDETLPSLPSDEAFQFTYSKTLLKRKLTDLNRIAPGLGDYILMSMKSYNWVLVDTPLTSIKIAKGAIKLPAGARVLQIANRSDLIIRINRAVWQKLDDANKIALLIHEAVFSLLRPIPDDAGFMVQPADVAYKITGSFFTNSFYTSDPASVWQTLTYHLSIPERQIPLVALRQAKSWTLFLSLLSSSCPSDPSSDYCLPQFFSRSVEVFNSPENSISLMNEGYPLLERKLSAYCAETLRTAKANPQEFYTIQSTLISPPVRVSVGHYPASNSKQEFQANISVEDNANSTSKLWFPLNVGLNDVSNCLNAFAKHLKAAAKEAASSL
jgi:hypothetical protein